MTDPTKTSQVKQIYRYFCAGGTLTNSESRAMFGCDRLAARANDIRNIIPDDEKIVTVMVKVGHNKRVGRSHRKANSLCTHLAFIARIAANCLPFIALAIISRGKWTQTGSRFIRIVLNVGKKSRNFATMSTEKKHRLFLRPAKV